MDLFLKLSQLASLNAFFYSREKNLYVITESLLSYSESKPHRVG